MKSEEMINWKIAVIGAGTMGLCIAQFFAMKGHIVYLYNRTPENLEKAMGRIRDNLNTLLSLEYIHSEVIEETMKRIQSTSEIKEAVANADYIIENVAEKVEVKQAVFQQIDAYASKDAIIASDTSSMDIFRFVEISHPERLIITHFFNPAYVMPLVEVVRGPKTSDKVTETIRTFLEYSGKTVAVLNQVIPGFIINRFTSALSREACYMVEQGYTTFEDIDKAIVATYGPRFAFEGPCKLGDFVGLDVSAFVFNVIYPTLCNAESTSPVILNMVGQKKLGVKTGEGLCGTYDNPAKAYQNRDAQVIRMLKAIDMVNQKMHES
ncbi:MAG: 3-hydroxyacyl-CoA dehydrogenase family protein [Anaerovoracaceae bacterium]